MTRYMYQLYWLKDCGDKLPWEMVLRIKESWDSRKSFLLLSLSLSFSGTYTILQSLVNLESNVTMQIHFLKQNGFSLCRDVKSNKISVSVCRNVVFKIQASWKTVQSTSGEPLGFSLSTLIYMLIKAIQTSVSSIHFNIFVLDVYATV